MQEVLLMLKLVGCVFMITWIWFRTNAFYEYFHWLPFKFIIEYKKHLQTESINLVGFLNFYHTNFFIKLITCPMCTMAWLSIMAGLYTDISLMPCIYMLSLLIYSNTKHESF